MCFYNSELSFLLKILLYVVRSSFSFLHLYRCVLHLKDGNQCSNGRHRFLSKNQNNKHYWDCLLNISIIQAYFWTRGSGNRLKYSDRSAYRLWVTHTHTHTLTHTYTDNRVCVQFYWWDTRWYKPNIHVYRKH